MIEEFEEVKRKQEGTQGQIDELTNKIILDFSSMQNDMKKLH